MPKAIQLQHVEPDIDQSVGSVIRNSSIQFTKLYYRKDIEYIEKNLIEIASYNLNKKNGLNREDNLKDPWIVIYGSKYGRNQIEAFYIKVESFSETYLASAEYLFEAVELVKILIDKVTTALES